MIQYEQNILKIKFPAMPKENWTLSCKKLLGSTFYCCNLHDLKWQVNERTLVSEMSDSRLKGFCKYLLRQQCCII